MREEVLCCQFGESFVGEAQGFDVSYFMLNVFCDQIRHYGRNIERKTVHFGWIWLPVLC